MKKLLALALVLAALVSMTACHKLAADDLTKNVKPSKEAPQSVAEENSGDALVGLSDLGLRLLAMELEEGNPLLSPLSISQALSMTANGAAGNTLSQLEVLLGADTASLNAFFAGQENGKQLQSANSIWLKDDESLHVEEAFLQQNADCFEADIFSAPFDASTKDAINTWTSEHTDGLIPEILDQIPKDAVMYLVNALSFDARWEKEYKTSDVWDGRFTNAVGEETHVDFLHGEETLYLNDNGAQGFLKPYAGGRYAFAALLPEEGTDVKDYVNSLTGEKLHAILSSPEETVVEIAMPKFKAEFSAELSESLMALGVTDAFDGEKADFSRLGSSAEGNICISRVLHKTFLQLDEAGTKAGAATAVEMKAEGAMEYPYYVRLDRPFLYMIVDLETNLPVFLGVLTDAA